MAIIGIGLGTSNPGDTQLGGTDMNRAVFDYLAEKFKEENGFDPRQDLKARARLLEAAPGPHSLPRHREAA